MLGSWILLALTPLSPMARLAAADWPLRFEETFEQGAERWQPLDPQGWRVLKTDRGSVYDHFQKKSSYQPPHRSPLNISLLKKFEAADFDLTVDVLSTHPDYGHRDACLVFGYQDPAHFYYVHLGKKTDDHANQIFIVDGKPRVKISSKTTPGTPWDDQWHKVKIERRADEGTIKVYFDDMQNPVMEATDGTFKSGRFGLGSFDDTTRWDNLRIYVRPE